MKTIVYTFGVGPDDRKTIQFALQESFGNEEIVISPLVKLASYDLDGKNVSSAVDEVFIVIFREEGDKTAGDIRWVINDAVPNIKVI